MAKTQLLVVGLMSGTSCDGVDASLLKTDGETITEVGMSAYMPYDPQLQKALKAMLSNTNNVSIPQLLAISNSITMMHSGATLALLKESRIKPEDVDLIGFHGQTLYHNPKNRHTLQIGNPSLLARFCRINVVSDFRSRDIASGGQGAPLVPIYHKILFQNTKKPIAVVNIGGVANITYLDNDTMLAFDTGPGCALMNDIMSVVEGKTYDDEGATARRGKIHEDIVESVIKNNKYFSKKPPKSLDRNEFGYIGEEIVNLTLEDGMATLTYFTARAIYESAKFLPKSPLEWIICGGGRKNLFLMELLKKKFGLNAISIDEKGTNGDFVESQAFALLAARSYLNLPISFPSTTGVDEPCVGGAFYRF